MIQHYSPHNIHVRFSTRCATRSWRWRNRKNNICQGIRALQALTLCPSNCAFLFQRHLTGEFEKKYIGMYAQFCVSRGSYHVVSRSFFLLLTTIIQPHSELRFTLYPSPPTMARSFSMSGIPPAKKSLVVSAMATTSRANVAL